MYKYYDMTSMYNFRIWALQVLPTPLATYITTQTDLQQVFFSMIVQFLALVLVALLAARSLTTVYRRRTNKPMPPGPPGLPFIGNVLQIPSLPWFQFTKWSEEYGNVAFFLSSILRVLLT